MSARAPDWAPSETRDKVPTDMGFGIASSANFLLSSQTRAVYVFPSAPSRNGTTHPRNAIHGPFYLELEPYV